MDLVRSVLPSAYAVKARGIVLCAITFGAAYVYYLAVDSDEAIPPAAATLQATPVVRLAAFTSPMHVISDAEAHDGSSAPVPDRAQIARELQAGLSAARCYDGPINGRWTAASQVAMDAFLTKVNARLPVGEPDPSLIALVAAHPDATCSQKPNLVADIGTGAQTLDAASRKTERVAIAVEAPSAAFATAEPSDAHASEGSMLAHGWARPEMLVPSPALATSEAPSAAVAPVAAAGPDASRRAPQNTLSTPASPPPSGLPVMKVSTAEKGPPTLHFEGGSVIADTDPEKPVTAEAAASAREALRSEDDVNAVSKTAAPKAAQRAPKPAKRRAKRSDDSSFGVSFDSIQRSLSSLFD